MSKDNKIICFFLASTFIFGSFFVYNSFILASSGGAGRVVINEILFDALDADKGKEFIELYNKSNSRIDLAGWSLKYFNENSDPVSLASFKTSSNEDQAVIPAGGFLLIGFNNYEKENYNNAVADIKRAVALPNGKTQNGNSQTITIILLDNENNEIDKMSYDKNSITSEGQSLERDGSSFKIQINPNPQNTSDVLNSGGQNNSDQNVSNNQEAGTGDTTNTADTTDNNPAQNGSTTFQDNGVGDVSNYIPKIIITEFLPNPEDSDNENEFIEIYNNDNMEVDLEGWTMEDKAGKIKKFIIPERTVIKAGKYKVFYSDETKIALNNSGDGVILRNKNGDIVSETPVSDSAKEEQAYALDKSGKWVWTLRPTAGRENIIELEEQAIFSKDADNKTNTTDKANNIEDNNKNMLRENSTAFQNNISSSEQEYDFSDTIIISEIFPNPLGKDNQEGNYEWIELYNNSDEDVNLKGWQIDDVLNKGSKPYVIKEDSIIKAGEYKIFSYAETKIMLNNSGDEVNILWPDGEIIDSVKYEKTIEGQSYSLTSGGNWIWTFEITPGKENKLGSVLADKNILEDDFEYIFAEGEETDNEGDEFGDSDFIEANIKDLQHFEKYARVKAAGIVSVPPGIFADNVFYLNGVQIFSYEIKLPKIELGDELEIIGRISEVGGEKRILLENKNDIKILSRNNLVEPKLTSAGDVNESAEGFLVIVEGKVSQVKSDVFYLDDGSGQIKIYIKPQTGIIKPEIKIGDWMVITGQVSQTSLGYRILPRFQQDIKLSRISGASAAKASFMSGESGNGNVNNSNNNIGKNSLLEFLLFMIAAIVLIDWARMRKLKMKK